MLREPKEELLRLLAEKRLGNFERRRRRMIAAQNRLEQRGLSLSGIFALAKNPERFRESDPEVRRDVFSVLNLGFASDEEFDAELSEDRGTQARKLGRFDLMPTLFRI
jgi:hypothetical protein